MPRAPKAPGHGSAPRIPWEGSTRKYRLPADWYTTVRPRILARDNRICHVCGRAGADQVDHLRPGDDHSDTNLAAIHKDPCHARKSSREGQAARRRYKEAGQ